MIPLPSPPPISVGGHGISRTALLQTVEAPAEFARTHHLRAEPTNTVSQPLIGGDHREHLGRRRTLDQLLDPGVGIRATIGVMDEHPTMPRSIGEIVVGRAVEN